MDQVQGGKQQRPIREAHPERSGTRANRGVQAALPPAATCWVPMWSRITNAGAPHHGVPTLQGRVARERARFATVRSVADKTPKSVFIRRQTRPPAPSAGKLFQVEDERRKDHPGQRPPRTSTISCPRRQAVQGQMEGREGGLHPTTFSFPSVVVSTLGPR